MSTDYYCSRARCEHARAFHDADETGLKDFPGDDCETCDWHFTMTGSAGRCTEFTAEVCPKCEVGVVLRYGKPHVSPHRAALTRALTAQAWAVACACMLCAHPKPAYLAAVLAALPAPADLV